MQGLPSQPVEWEHDALRFSAQKEVATNAIVPPPRHKAYQSLLQRLKKAGFHRDFVERAILPDWWSDASAEDTSLLREIEIRVARFLGVPLTTVTEPGAALVAPAYSTAKLRRVRDIDRDRLAPAIHVGIQVAAAVVRNLRVREIKQRGLPEDGVLWRKELSPNGAAPRLADVAGALWTEGIPVVTLEHLPPPSFQGMACVVEGRSVILLGYKHDEPGRVAFVIAHEAGHIAAHDCAPGEPVVDEEDEITDETDIERRADEYATKVLVGDLDVPQVSVGLRDFKDLAQKAVGLERDRGVDASSVIFAWARRTGDYMTASMAVKAIYRHVGARRQLAQLFKQHIDVEAASETDRALLWLCAGGWPAHNAAR